MKRPVGLVAAGLVAFSSPAGAGEPVAAPAEGVAAAPSYFVAGAVGTTLSYRPPGGPVDGLQRDISLGVGLGRSLTATWFVELDVGVTFVDGEYVGLSLIPGVSWAFHPNLYGAFRLVVPVDPWLDLALAPGLGALHAFEDGLTPFVELNLLGYVGRGEGLGVTISVGAVIAL